MQSLLHHKGYTRSYTFISFPPRSWYKTSKKGRRPQAPSNPAWGSRLPLPIKPVFVFVFSPRVAKKSLYKKPPTPATTTSPAPLPATPRLAPRPAAPGEATRRSRPAASGARRCSAAARRTPGSRCRRSSRAVSLSFSERWPRRFCGRWFDELGGGGQNRFGIPVWLVGEFTTHF